MFIYINTSRYPYLCIHIYIDLSYIVCGIRMTSGRGKGLEEVAREELRDQHVA